MKKQKDLEMIDYEIEYDEFEDDENDDLYRPKKMNSVKSLAPLYISIILQNKTDEEHPMLQKDIRKILQDMPFEISLERKAVSRIVNALCDTGLGYISIPKYGVYYDEGAARYRVS